MILIDILVWWYSVGWIKLLKRNKQFITDLIHQFSVPILLKTLFSPWKRIVTQSRNLKEQLNAIRDNLISRAIGFVIRLFVLSAAFIIVTIVTLGTIFLLILWPLVPFLWIIPFVIELPHIDLTSFFKV